MKRSNLAARTWDQVTRRPSYIWWHGGGIVLDPSVEQVFLVRFNFIEY